MTPTGWSAGDTLTVDTEAVTLNAISGNTITSFSPSLALTHYTTTTIRIADLSHNVLVRSSGTNTSTNTAFILNIVQNTTSINENNAEIDYEGIGFNGGVGAQRRVCVQLHHS